ncbi:AraC family transcriptional regulator [Pseudaestuariivita atlantica]|uniref:HTH araC/xylS-type domain-containing protein n=1 Tax=Pseudaestuariivita atlantica TaxID=1317121 RepID=A0A0L1JU10_9RHOB|nr:AraC family transcriptional regulator [Pseudaestuariivita atlantica]KNG94893.1 hypothetical protein ATO11_05850 [Pseudaestuariivita atlantica]
MSRNGYIDRVNRVIDHIHANAGERLSLDVLADVAAMSPYHWHRVYHAMTGETCAQTVRRIRLYRAGVKLIETGDPVEVIARDVGYPVLRSFNRAFADLYGLTPQAFRVRGARPRTFKPNAPTGDLQMLDTQITDVPTRRMAALRHKGAYSEISRTFAKLSAQLAEANAFAHVRGMAAVYFDDPMVTPEPELTSDAGALLADGATVPEGLTDLTLPEGKVARFEHRGPYTGLPAAYTWIYATWLPESGEELDDFPSYEVYVNSPLDTAPDDLVTHIFVPLR